MRKRANLWIYPFLLMGVLFVMISGCKKDDSEITSNTPTSGVPNKSIVFTSNEAIYKIDINSKKQQVLFSSNTIWMFNQIKFSPNKERIVFSANVNNVRQIFIIKSDGTELKQLTHNNNDSDHPAWSSDGNKIVYVKWHYPKTTLVVIDLNGNNEQYLLETDFYGIHYPIWSPDGSKIAMQAKVNSFYVDIVVMKNDGTMLFKTENRFFGNNQNRMRWTADSKNIIFSTTNENIDQGNIGVLNISDQSITWLTSNENDGLVDVSKAGKVAFYSTRDGNAKIYTMDFDGKNQIPVTIFRSTHPRWLSDGKRIVCKSWNNTLVSLYIINADGTSPEQLSEEGDYFSHLTSFDL
jgi:Tol biopolymer transport system component